MYVIDRLVLVSVLWDSYSFPLIIIGNIQFIKVILMK